ncbi:MAG: acyl-CoA carboxylase subunit epsilon [Micromonosporaceae bacterium]
MDLRIVRGVPDDEEVAALVAVLFGLPSNTVAAPAPAASRWAASTRPRSGRLGGPGRASWRGSTLPR